MRISRQRIGLVQTRLSSPGAAMVYGVAELSGRDGAEALADRLKKVSARELRRAAERVYE